jgi:hypothetical protein
LNAQQNVEKTNFIKVQKTVKNYDNKLKLPSASEGIIVTLMKFKIFLILLMSILTTQNGAAESAIKDKVMNGIQLNDFTGFEKNWRLVTVRFRKDTQEMRWTFANDLAWKTLSSGSIEYPVGAVFAKIGAATHEDSQFPSSAIPSGARRYQFMVRDNEKYKETGGWGYALFDVEGNLFPDPIKETSMACFACHQIVSNRGQVFSQPFLFSGGSSALIESTFLSEKKGFRVINFEWKNTNLLSKKLKSQLPPDFKKIRVVSDKAIRKNIFHGTLDEIRPRLELEAYTESAPAALISEDGSQFSW